MIPLEDNFNDIISKAMRGMKFTAAHVANEAGVEAKAVEELTDGKWDTAVARQIAPVLGLGADALIAAGEKKWAPAPIAIEGLAQINTPYEDYTVNSYLVWDSESGEAAAFDTGADCAPLLELLTSKNLKLVRIFITHTHGDHIFDLDRLKEKTGAPAVVGSGEPIDGAETFDVGASFSVGKLSIETRLTWGHSKGAVTYVISGLAQPVAIVGDAIFAGSMGGGMVSYEAALQTNRDQILSLSNDTILCPGHGPLTTVGEQKTHNPFFAA